MERKTKVSPLESIASHAVLVLATCFALYPVLWVVSMAFSAHRPAVPEVIPALHEPTASRTTTRRYDDTTCDIHLRRVVVSSCHRACRRQTVGAFPKRSGE